MSIPLCTVELVLFYIMLLIGAGFIYKGKLIVKALFFSPLIFAPWAVMTFVSGISYAEWAIYITLILEVIACRITFSGISIFKPLFLTLLLYELMILMTAVLMIIFDIRMHYNSYVEFLVVCTLFIVMMMLCLTRAKEIVVIIVEKSSLPAKIIFFCLLTFNMFFMMILAAEPVGEEVQLKDFYIRVAVVLFVFLLLVVTGYIFFSSIYTKQMKFAAEAFKEQIKKQSKYYQNMSLHYRELRRMRHDSRNMCIGLKELISQGRNEEALEMINNRYRDLEAASSRFSSGNGVVDAILSDKQDKALAAGANITFEGNFPETGISPEHLCIIFGNTLDNAIEACASVPGNDKQISVSCVPTGSYIFITITNPVLSKVRVKNGLPRTTKEDKSAHGLGLYSLSETVKSCKGELNLHCTESLFTVTIELFVDQPERKKLEDS